MMLFKENVFKLCMVVVVIMWFLFLSYEISSAITLQEFDQPEAFDLKLVPLEFPRDKRLSEALGLVNAEKYDAAIEKVKGFLND